VDFQVSSEGDSTLVIEFDDRVDPVVNARVIWLADAIQHAGIAGIRDVVPTYRSVAVFFDPLRTSYKNLVDWVTRAASAVPRGEVEQSQTLIRVPVCYDEDLGPDLLSVASLANLSTDQVVALHASMTYRVFMLGFLPGFAYMGIVDERIRAPRRATPRPRVPRGAVGIAGAQTGVYPLDVPGGWQLIGRTPVRPFDPFRKEPFLFKPGDAVRFTPIDRSEYEASSVLP
jgi:KipI family sensor histidine kinase inhibitor